MSLSYADFDFVRKLVREKAAIVLEDDKGYLVEARLGMLARREGIESPQLLVAQLRQGKTNGIHQKVVEALTTNETSFFRDLHPFEALRMKLLPELAQKRAGERSLRIWCAAASTGQEPYSLAMLLHEETRLAGWNISFLATDLSTEVLGRAKEGVFTQAEVNRGLPARLLIRYFRQHHGNWQIKDELRKMIDFRSLNLIDPWPALPPQDFIFIRNVLIYFDVNIKRQILSRARRLLRPDGYLFLGGSETTMGLDEGFERVDLKGAGCYRLKA